MELPVDGSELLVDEMTKSPDAKKERGERLAGEEDLKAEGGGGGGEGKQDPSFWHHTTLMLDEIQKKASGMLLQLVKLDTIAQTRRNQSQSKDKDEIDENICGVARQVVGEDT